MPAELAGRQWVARYPTERSTAGLAMPWRRAVQSFIFELERRACAVKINATRRPAERAWLMHYAWRIAREGLDPAAVPARPTIAITWTRDGAREMAEGYGLAYRPSLTSRHIGPPGGARAIDMTISEWTGTRDELDDLGRSFGVYPLAGDPPHWSDDGR